MAFFPFSYFSPKINSTTFLTQKKRRKEKSTVYLIFRFESGTLVG
jgi:hypothetical protein